MRILIFLTSILLAAVPLLASSDVATADESPSAVVQAKTYQGLLPVITVSINGTSTAQFIVDTGSTSSFIIEQFVKQKKLKEHDATRFYPWLPDQKPTHDKATDLVCEVGGNVFPTHRFIVFPGLLAGLDPIIVGLLGADFFSNSTVELDNFNHLFKIWPDAKFIGANDPTEPPYWKIPLLDSKDPRPYVVAKLYLGSNVVTQPLLVDSAGNVTVMLRSVAVGLQAKPFNRQPRPIQNELGVHDTQIIGIDEIEFGDGANPLRLKNKLIECYKDDIPRETSVLAPDFLPNFRMIFDFPGRTFYLKLAFDPRVKSRSSNPPAVQN